MPTSESYGEKASNVISWFFVLSPLIFVPFSLYVLNRYTQSGSPYGSLSQGLNLGKRGAIYFIPLFIARRLSFSLIAIFLSNGMLQLSIFMGMTIAQLIFLVHVKPMESPLLNGIEIFNEVITLTNSYFMLLFTDTGVDQELEYRLGWYLIGLTFICIVFNLVIIIIDFGKPIVDFARYIFRRRPKESGFEGISNIVDAKVRVTHWRRRVEESKKRKTALEQL